MSMASAMALSRKIVGLSYEFLCLNSVGHGLLDFFELTISVKLRLERIVRRCPVILHFLVMIHQPLKSRGEVGVTGRATASFRRTAGIDGWFFGWHAAFSSHGSVWLE